MSASELYDPDRDRELLAQCDEEAWERFIGYCTPRLLSLGLNRLRSWDLSLEQRVADVRDLASDCIAQTFEKCLQGTIRRNEVAYALDKMGRLVQDWFRRKSGPELRPELAQTDVAGVPDEVAAREETGDLFRMVRRGVWSLHREVIEDVRRTEAPTFRQSPFLHTAVLDLTAAGIRALSEIGAALAQTDASQLTRMRAAAWERALGHFRHRVRQPLDEGLFDSELFGEAWRSGSGGCFLEQPIRLPQGSVHAVHRELQLAVHLDTVRCPGCLAVERATPSQQREASELARYLSVTISHSIASRRGFS